MGQSEALMAKNVEIKAIDRQRKMARAELDLSYFVEDLQKKLKLDEGETLKVLQHESNVQLSALLRKQGEICKA
jgi:hypothetical protein